MSTHLHPNVPLSISTEHSSILTNLDTLLHEINTKIARLKTQKEALEQARNYIRASPTVRSMAHHPSARRPSSTLRRQAILRNALEQEKSPSPPESRGLLASEDFEAAFEREGDVVVSVEQNQYASIPETVAPVSSAIPDQETASMKLVVDSAESTMSNEPVCGKCVIKRKRQANAAKARDARKRKLDEASQKEV
jgi:hypothetical protein